MLDDFNRTDGAIGANWTSPLSEFSNPVVVSSNQAAGNISNTSFFAGALWNDDSFTDGAVYGTIGAGASTAYGAGLLLHIIDVGADLRGYWLAAFALSSPYTVSLTRLDADTGGTTLSSLGGVTINPGDKFKFVSMKNAFTVYQDSGSGWTHLSGLDATDSTYPSGQMGITTYLQSTWDDFGGGVPYTVINGTQSLLTLTQGDTVNPLSKKSGILLTSAGLASLLTTPGVTVYKEPEKALIQTRRKTLMLAAHRRSS